jgi:hypothetical protein
MEQGFEITAETPTALIDLLSFHAGEIAMNSPGSALYAASVFRRAAEVEALLINKAGEVKGVVTSWEYAVQPLLEAVFGRSLEGEELGAFRDYSPTIISGVYGRTRIVSTDEIFGPCIALDLAAESAIGLEK